MCLVVLVSLALLSCLTGCGKKEDPPQVLFLRDFLAKYYMNLDPAALKEVTRGTYAVANLVLSGLQNDRYYPKLALNFDTTKLTYTVLEGDKKTDTKSKIQVAGPLLVKTVDDPAGRSMDVDFPVQVYLNNDHWEADFTHDFFQYSTIQAGEELGIVAGPKGSLEYMMGLDLRMLGKRTGLNIYVYEGNNAEDRIMAIKEADHIQVGFIQQDALLFVQSGLSKLPLIRTAAKELRALCPLYTETVQIIGQRRIKTLDQFSGRIVAIGTPESASYITGNLVFYLGGVPTHSLLAAGGEQALSALQNQKVDGMLQTGSVPWPLYQEIDPELRMGLVSVNSPALQELYSIRDIPAGSYPWQKNDVISVGVTMVLATRNYTGAMCKVLGYFSDMIRDNIAWLAANGESAWKDVRLNAPLVGWRIYDCVDKVRRKEQGRYQ